MEGREGFVVCTLVDLSAEKRRQAIERMFFHDILNAAGGVKGCTALLRGELEGGANSELAGLMDQGASELLSDLRGQQLLAQAVDGRLKATPKAVDPLEVVWTAAAELRDHSQSKERTILVDPLSEDLRMETDPAILSRVLGIMLKNALAATPPGGTVTIGCQASEGGVEFYVHNPGVIPRPEQLQTFQRSLSTNNGGGVLSAYKMKLLTERYLGGTIRFESSPLHGTRFVARCPRGLQGRLPSAIHG
jgi:signal transduction histidine kinase